MHENVTRALSVSTMDAESTDEQTPNLQSGSTHEEFQPQPELLMAARRGDWGRLKHLLAEEDDAAAAAAAELADNEVVVHVGDADAMDVEIGKSSANAMAHGEAVTVARDSLLHEVASRGDGENFLKSATVIHAKLSSLLGARNKNGDTPMHCAARAGCGGMVSHLVALARAENGGVGAGDERVKAILRKQNGQGETVLHEAVRLGDADMIDWLMSEDSWLARVPPAGGASPLYLAVALGRDDIARQLYEKDGALSYSGPDGQNALHVAVLKGKGPTKMLLEWNKSLTKQAERSTGSTPLHFAASWGKHDVITLLLDADESAAYQADIHGSFPIHLAAFSNKAKAVDVLLGGRRRDCAELRDARGMTFLHVAVLEESQNVVTYACKMQSKRFAAVVMNMQDDDGFAALHLAVQVGNLWVFNPLMKNRLVQLNLENNKGQTPLDISWTTKPVGIHYGLNPRVRIYTLLQVAGAQNGTYRWDVFHEKHILRLNEREEAEKISDSAQTIGIGSMLIATVAFAAAFALPGGYRADDHDKGGAPTLAGHYAFDVFIIANTLTFICSGLSIVSLMYAGVAAVDIRTRMISFVFSVTFMTSSARSLGAAFAFGLYVVLAPVARTTAVASCAITALALIDAVWFIWVLGTGELMLLKRLGVRAWWRLAWAILVTLLSQFWPYIVIAGVLTYSKMNRVH